jgi:hypothetical protein
MAQFPINKIRRDVMPKILNKYLKRGIFEASSSAWRAPAFLGKRSMNQKSLWHPSGGKSF